MATIPVDEHRIIDAFGPHLSAMTGVRLSTSVEPERLVKTHCCFCGQQCGIQLKVRDNQVIGFEPWEDFPFNRGMLCPKGVKRYLQGSHPDRLVTALARDPKSPSGFGPLPYDAAIRRVASEIELLRASLVQPQLAMVEIGAPDPGPHRQLWLVTRTLENGYLVVFDPESQRFGLAVAGENPPPQTVAVWGDLVNTFMAR